MDRILPEKQNRYNTRISDYQVIVTRKSSYTSKSIEDIYVDYLADRIIERLTDEVCDMNDNKIGGSENDS